MWTSVYGQSNWVTYMGADSDSSDRIKRDNGRQLGEIFVVFILFLLWVVTIVTNLFSFQVFPLGKKVTDSVCS